MKKHWEEELLVVKLEMCLSSKMSNTMKRMTDMEKFTSNISFSIQHYYIDKRKFNVLLCNVY